jgi:hypothetical protein
MLAKVVAIQQVLSHASACRIERRCVIGHPRYGLEDNRIVRGLRRRAAPAERRVTGDQHRRHRKRIYRGCSWGCSRSRASSKATHNGMAGVQHIISTNFVGGQLLGHRNRPIEVVGMSGAVSWNLPAGLCPCSSEF